MNNNFQLKLFFISTILVLSACGSSSKTNSNNSTSDSGSSSPSIGLPNNINGLIVLNTWTNAGNNYGIYSIDFVNGQISSSRRLTTENKGINPYAHDRNTITYAEPCSGQYTHHRLKTIDENGLSSAQIIPCSSDLWGSVGKYEVAKISPDKSKVAIELDSGINTTTWNTKYLIKIFDVSTGEELYSYMDYQSPEWHPSGRLLLAASDENNTKGIFITDKDFNQQLTRIDLGKINQSVSYLNLNSSSNKLIFAMSGRVWIMNINESYKLSVLQEIISESAVISAPTWSPDGQYIAYLNESFNMTFWHVESQKPYVFPTDKVLPLHANGYQWISPGYFSWVE